MDVEREGGHKDEVKKVKEALGINSRPVAEWVHGLKDDEKLNAWIKLMKNKAPSTRQTYLFHMKGFLDGMGLSPSQLYEMRKADIDSDDVFRAGCLERGVIAYRDELLANGLSVNHAKSVRKAVSSFIGAVFYGPPIRIYGLLFNENDGLYSESEGKMLIQRGQIERIHADIGGEFRERNRALLMFAKDSGLRVSDLSALKVGHYRHAREAPVIDELGRKFLKFKPFRSQKRVKGGRKLAQIRVGPDAVEAVDVYLETREGDLDDDDPLFALGDGGRMSPNTLSTQFRRFIPYLPEKEREGLSAHSFRKFHNNALPGAGLPSTWVYTLIGKKIPGSMKNYTMPDLLEALGIDEDALTEAYMKAYKGIQVLDAPDEKYRKEIQELRTQVEESARARSDMENVIDGLKAGIKTNKEFQKDIIQLLEMAEIDSNPASRSRIRKIFRESLDERP